MRDCDIFIRKLNLTDIKETTAFEIGGGTGSFTVQAAKYFKKILAVDVSDAMLKIAKEKVQKRFMSKEP
ncbi:MAG: class I SAM-dependent methyltransferase [Spirochaetia bacterium]|nr:class I SAM-dependent methyltransferase [Spirochaetia bacterium]